MKIIVCLDDRNGMLFHKRRQSSDRVLTGKIIELAGESTLWMHPYSQKLFDGTAQNICVDPLFLKRAGQGDYCFVETEDVSAYAASIEEIILFRWNRAYPADLYFPVELLKAFGRKDHVLTFCGNSHDKITMEVFVR